MSAKDQGRLDMDAVRAKLNGSDGRGYWRGLEELAETPEFTQWLGDEFPHRRSLLEVDRRSVLKVMGASLALAGLTGCRNLPQEKVIPFVKDPEGRPAGIAQYYATALTFGGYGFPVLVESHEGRPTKLEGNPDHPASGGASDIFTQAAILNLYDPDRLQHIAHQGLLDTWDNFLKEIRLILEVQRPVGGRSIRLLTGTVASPSLAAAIGRLMKEFPELKWHQYEPANRDNEKKGTLLAFGKMLQPHYDFAKANAVLALDADFMASNPHQVRHARDFASRRDLNGPVSRLYSVESTPSLTGAFADHRAAVAPSEVFSVAVAVASALGIAVPAAKAPSGVSTKWVDAVAADLRAGGVVIAGAHQSPEVHALAHAINTHIQAPVRYTELAEAQPAIQGESLAELVTAMQASAVQLLIVAGGNPVYSAPGDLQFGQALSKVQHSIYFGEFGNETSAACSWTVPQSSFLEAWGDAVTPDGTATIVQPLIEPLYPTKNALEFFAALAGDQRTGEQIVRDTWKAKLPTQVAWEKALNDGSVPGTALPAVQASANVSSLPAPESGAGPWAVFVPDPTVWDGEWANNGWLQELPKPLTKMTWDNAVYMSPKQAEDLGVNFQDHVKVRSGDREVVAPVFVQPGHPDNVVTLHMGYGRTKGGKVLPGCGTDFMKLRNSKNPWVAQVQVEKVPGSTPLATAQLHHSMEGRDIVREGTLAQYQADPTLKPEGLHELEDVTLYNLTEEWKQHGYAQWGMTIDLNLCVGCNACVTACQAENNIPTVGKVEVQRGRELHWIRIDRYYRVKDSEGARDVGTGAAQAGIESARQTGKVSDRAKTDILDSGKVETLFQPVTCMHCETAPCEPVCPVAATVHSHEGLNQMVYNRCVGTRYCSNNCPYKVRRFNYYNYQHGQRDVGLSKDYGSRNFQGEKDVPLLRLLSNPDVTVRSRGVMEKCTYCVQRINEARIAAKKENRDMRDGEIVTACQQACPTRAIEFGNIADPESAVSRKRADQRTYGLLTEVNTRPRTTYLGKVRNPNPELENA